MDRKKAINILSLRRQNAIGTLGNLPREANDTAINVLVDEIYAYEMAIEALQKPQVGSVEINKDFENILLCAVRYAIGRQTYMPSLVIDYITPLLPYLTDNTLRLIANEITEYEGYEGGLGDEKIDRPYWLAFYGKILAERMKQNGEL